MSLNQNDSLDNSLTDNSQTDYSAQEEQLYQQVVENAESISPEQAPTVLRAMGGRLLEFIGISKSNKTAANSEVAAANTDEAPATDAANQVETAGAPADAPVGANAVDADAVKDDTKVIDGEDEDPLGTALDDVSALGAGDTADASESKDKGKVEAEEKPKDEKPEGAKANGIPAPQDIAKSHAAQVANADSANPAADEEFFDVGALLEEMRAEITASAQDRADLVNILKSVHGELAELKGELKTVSNELAESRAENAELISIQKSMLSAFTQDAMTPAGHVRDVSKGVGTAAVNQTQSSQKSEEDPMAPAGRPPAVVRELRKAFGTHDDDGAPVTNSLPANDKRFGISASELRGGMYEAFDNPEINAKYGLGDFEFGEEVKKSFADMPEKVVKAVAESLGKLN